jgi:hypothetical protein
LAKKKTPFQKKSTFLKKTMELLLKLAKVGGHCKKKLNSWVTMTPCDEHSSKFASTKQEK